MAGKIIAGIVIGAVQVNRRIKAMLHLRFRGMEGSFWLVRASARRPR